MHRALDFQIAAVMPALLGRVPFEADEAIALARDAAVAPVREMIDRAQRQELLRPDVAFGDIGLMLVRLSRPLPALPRELSDQLAHRHVDLFVQGLRERAGQLPGPALGLAELRRTDPSVVPPSG